MKKQLIINGIAILSLVGGTSPVFGQTAAPTGIAPVPENSREQAKNAAEVKREAVKEVTEQKREAVKSAGEARVEAVKAAGEAKREAIKEASEQKREAIKETVTQGGDTNKEVDLQKRLAAEADRKTKQEALETLKTEREASVKAAQEKKREALESLKAERKTAGEVSREAVDRAHEAVKNAQEEFKAKREVEREAFKTKLETAREELKTKRETEKAELKARLEKIKDEKKKAATERLDNRFTEINAKLAEQWGNALTRMEELLAKVGSRADKAELNGKDVSATRTAAEKAKGAIETAKNAAAVQAAKTYPITVTDETALKSAVAVARELLNKDLAGVRDSVQAAKKAISDANSALRKISGVDDLTAPVPAPQPAVSETIVQ